MKYEEQKRDLEERLDTFYEIIYTDIYNASSINSVLKVFDKEYNRMKMMAEYVRDDLGYQIKANYRGKDTPREKEEMKKLLDRLNQLNVSPVAYDFSEQKGKNDTKDLPPIVKVTEKDANGALSEYMIIGAVAGGIGGAIVGAGIVTFTTGITPAVLGGAAVGALCGAVIGGIIGYSMEQKEAPVTANVFDKKVEPRTPDSSLDKNYIVSMMKQRQLEMKRLFFKHIELVEGAIGNR